MATVLITGGDAGLGWAASTRLAEMRFNLVLAGRNPQKIEKAAKQLRERFGVLATVLPLDLASLQSVRAAAEAVRSMITDGTLEPLQALLCNAGAQFRGPISYSADGFEETFAVNCLGTFLFADLVLDSIADKGRVVFTVSGTHDPDTMDGRAVGASAYPDAEALCDHGKNGRKPILGGRRYASSKLCDILYSYELDRRLKAARQPLSSIAFDPGLIPETGLVRTAPRFVQWLSKTRMMKWFLRKIGVTMGSLSFSGSALAAIATDAEFADASGKYFQSNNGRLSEARSSKVSYDQEKAARLWQDSERLVKLRVEERPRRLR